MTKFNYSYVIGKDLPLTRKLLSEDGFCLQLKDAQVSYIDTDNNHEINDGDRIEVVTTNKKLNRNIMQAYLSEQLQTLQFAAKPNGELRRSLYFAARDLPITLRQKFVVISSKILDQQGTIEFKEKIELINKLCWLTANYTENTKDLIGDYFKANAFIFKLCEILFDATRQSPVAQELVIQAEALKYGYVVNHFRFLSLFAETKKYIQSNLFCKCLNADNPKRVTPQEMQKIVTQINKLILSLNPSEDVKLEFPEANVYFIDDTEADYGGTIIGDDIIINNAINVSAKVVDDELKIAHEYTHMVLNKILIYLEGNSVIIGEYAATFTQEYELYADAVCMQIYPAAYEPYIWDLAKQPNASDKQYQYRLSLEILAQAYDAPDISALAKLSNASVTRSQKLATLLWAAASKRLQSMYRLGSLKLP
ncbi:MAG: hypothetical protein JW841_11030 [Deltaproteobacteria bacterium]|nr:hypothetical protein [Deltaproteobacteria bacterium]